MECCKFGRFCSAGLVAVAMLGCHTVGDPACDVRHELSDVGCRDVLSAPDLDLTKVTRTPWYRCAPSWAPGCGPLFCRPAAARRLPTVDAVFALPASQNAVED